MHRDDDFALCSYHKAENPLKGSQRSILPTCRRKNNPKRKLQSVTEGPRRYAGPSDPISPSQLSKVGTDRFSVCARLDRRGVIHNGRKRLPIPHGAANTLDRSWRIWLHGGIDLKKALIRDAITLAAFLTANSPVAYADVLAGPVINLVGVAEVVPVQAFAPPDTNVFLSFPDFSSTSGFKFYASATNLT